MLNLADVPYIDSAGLGEIVRTYTTVSRQGGSLKLLNLTKRITDLLAITKLLTVFETFDTENDAVKSFRRLTASPSPALHGATHFVRITGAADAPATGASRPVRRRHSCSSRCARSSGPRTCSSSPGCCSACSCSTEPPSSRPLAAFAVFCALSGVVYLVNDVVDREPTGGTR